ncbi:MAG TPA: SRPBCC family protein [Terriglobales bacterium]|nr:SRPBCC family protein [Terriglobales bacterium]
MSAYVFRAEQWIDRNITDVFAFFSRAENLQRLTPPWLHFRILGVEPNPVRKGTLIRYSLRWRVFPLRWTTEIVEWDPPHRFVDVQLKGPYRLWHHEHRFVAEGARTHISDEVHYELPLGVIGSLAHRLKVRRDVETIFAFRRKAVEKVFTRDGADRT